MRFIIRLLWKCLPKRERFFLLERFPVHERQAINKVLSGNNKIVSGFEQNNCIFIHVPKCAGESVCKSLFGKGPGHLPLTWYERTSPDLYERAFKFTFVRDPLERAYSAYHYLKNDRGIERDAHARSVVEQYADFDAFVKGWLCPENVLKQMHFAPQWLLLCNSAGHIAVDFIGRQERMAEDFACVCQKLGVCVDLAQVNRSLRAEKSAREMCSDEALRIIADVYRRDYALLGYPLPI